MTLPALLLAALTGAAAPRVEVLPSRVRPGDAFLVRARHLGGPPPRGSAAGRDLSFFRVSGGFAAIGALPVETPAGPLAIRVSARDGRALPGELEVAPADFPHRQLELEPRFVEPPTPTVERRIAEDRAAFARAYAQPPSPPLFARRFAWPRRDRVTAGFGEERILNGVKPSQHYGLDLAGRVGAPVVASNAGEVVMVRDCWASGRTVIVWHGAGIYTTYMHLSRALVRPGARVARGQRLGQVGQTGRATGPHLHWSVRVGDLYVNPRSVLSLPIRIPR